MPMSIDLANLGRSVATGHILSFLTLMHKLKWPTGHRWEITTKMGL